VFQSGLLFLSLVISLGSSFTENIERSFLQNNPRLLFPLLGPGEPVHVSLPPPISFSDEVSSEQAFFLFRKIFRTYTTFEFFPEPGAVQAFEGGSFIFRARWSFLNRNRNQYVFLIFFYVRARPGASRPEEMWKISEIRAEQL
jgi:hypothetical protein